MTVFIMGDTHWGVGDEQKVIDLKAKSEDTVIICGDAGIVWYNQKKKNKAIKQIAQLPFTVVYALGNHENYHALKCGIYPEVIYNGAKCHKIAENCYQVENGEFMELEGKVYWFCGGAASTDKHSRIEKVDWWSEEVPKDWQINQFYDKVLEKGKVDYIISHQCPQWVEKELFRSWWDYTAHDDYYLTKMFDEVYEEVEFTHWYCGHHHVDQTFEKCTVLYDNMVEI